MFGMLTAAFRPWEVSAIGSTDSQATMFEIGHICSVH
jgi:hypothetical protein